MTAQERREQRMEETLKKLPFWEHLEEKERRLLEREAQVKRFPAGGQLFGTADACLGMVHVLDGELRAYILSREGREITLFRLRDGDTGVLSASCALSQIRFETHLAAVRETEILLIPSRAVASLTEENVHVRCCAYELAASRFSDVTAVLQEIIFAPFDQRLASFLLREADASPDGQICMTQGEMAARVNSAREVVARMLKRFDEEGLIEYGRGRIVLRDRERLEKLSEH